MDERKLKKLIALVCVTTIFFVGCGSDKLIRFPVSEYTHVMNLETDGVEETYNEDVVDSKTMEVPVNYYIDNTDSMHGFIYDKLENKKPSAQFTKFLTSLNDMGYESEFNNSTCYVIKDKKWQKTKNELMNIVLDETKDGSESSYYKWITEQGDTEGGPLTALHVKSGNIVQGNAISVILTDLAEENQRITQFGAEIRDFCKAHDYRICLYSFKFKFNGYTEVADPENPLDISGRKLSNEDRAYYMIAFGQEGSLDKYCRIFESKLDNVGFKEEKDYYKSSNINLTTVETLSKEELDNYKLSIDNIVFSPEKDKKDYNGEITDKFNYNSDNFEDTQLMQRIDNIDDFFEDSEFPLRQIAVFDYQNNISDADEFDWWISFSLNRKNNNLISYEPEYEIYYLETIENSISDGDEEYEHVSEWINKDLDKSSIKINSSGFSFAITQDKKKMSKEKNPPQNVLVLLKVKCIFNTKTTINDLGNSSVLFKEFNAVEKKDSITKTYRFKDFYNNMFDISLGVNSGTEDKWEQFDCFYLPVIIKNLPVK